MSDRSHNRLIRPETLTAVGIILIAAGFLVPTADLRSISALLPAAMLFGLIVLALALLVMDQRKAAKTEAPAQMTQSPKRVAGAFLLILGYALACDFIGFYVSTALTIPLVAFAFGYRNPLGLLVATAIVVGSIWLIFDFGMSQSFPAGRLWKD